MEMPALPTPPAVAVAEQGNQPPGRQHRSPLFMFSMHPSVHPSSSSQHRPPQCAASPCLAVQAQRQEAACSLTSLAATPPPSPLTPQSGSPGGRAAPRCVEAGPTPAQQMAGYACKLEGHTRTHTTQLPGFFKRPCDIYQKPLSESSSSSSSSTPWFDYDHAYLRLVDHASTAK